MKTKSALSKLKKYGTPVQDTDDVSNLRYTTVVNNHYIVLYTSGDAVSKIYVGPAADDKPSPMTPKYRLVDALREALDGLRTLDIHLDEWLVTISVQVAHIGAQLTPRLSVGFCPIGPLGVVNASGFYMNENAELIGLAKEVCNGGGPEGLIDRLFELYPDTEQEVQQDINKQRAAQAKRKAALAAQDQRVLEWLRFKRNHSLGLCRESTPLTEPDATEQSDSLPRLRERGILGKNDVPLFQPGEPQPASYKVGVKTSGDRDWVYNGMSYTSYDEAHSAGYSLAMRWWAVEQWEVHGSSDVPNSDGNGSLKRSETT